MAVLLRSVGAAVTVPPRRTPDLSTVYACSALQT